MNSNFQIRQAAKDDLKSISLLEKAFKPMNYPTFILRQFYDLFPDLFYVAVDEHNQVIAYCFGGINQDSNIGWIFALYVIEKEQKKKIGQRITIELLSAFKDKAINTIQLTTTPDNITAIYLYEKLGFKKLIETKDYYFNNSPRIVMQLKYK